jgi:flavin reductase (DIM6/NTAB) family NADH-FMN oxidoreductase RutF
VLVTTHTNAIMVNQTPILRSARCGAQIECRVTRETVFEHRDGFVGEVVAARKRADHRETEALLCGRHRYALTGATVAPR